MKPLAALAAAALFASQPLLWGHAFINPKDIPFLVFYIASVYLGLRMVDQIVERSRGDGGAHPLSRSTDMARKACAPWVVCGAALAATCLVLIAHFGEVWVRQVVQNAVVTAYHAPGDSTMGRLFAWLASRAKEIPVEAYIQKAWILFLRARTALDVATPILLLSSGAVLLPRVTQRVLRAVDRILAPAPSWPTIRSSHFLDWPLVRIAVLPGILLGLATSIRLIGPLAGGIVVLYFLLRAERRSLAPVVIYFSIACVALLVTWPYLWPSPVARLLEVVRHMADNPKIVPVLYRGSVIMSNQLPRDYLPRFLAITLTEPTWILFLGGIMASGRRLFQRTLDWREWGSILVWFFVPLLYVVLRRPAMYDGYRHFLFVLPPVFAVAGIGVDAILSRLKSPPIKVLLLVALVVPGLVGIVRLHPYEYTYYNSLVGGTGGAFRTYETDYWLTCYRAAMLHITNRAQDDSVLYVRRQPSLARQYAPEGMRVELYDPEVGQVPAGALLLLTTRTDADLGTYPDAPVLATEGREGAVFCVLKYIPDQ